MYRAGFRIETEMFRAMNMPIWRLFRIEFIVILCFVMFILLHDYDSSMRSVLSKSFVFAVAST